MNAPLHPSLPRRPAHSRSDQRTSTASRFEFHRCALRSPGHERAIAGLTYAGLTYASLEIALFIDGCQRTGLRINEGGASIVAEAIDCVRRSSYRAFIGAFEDGRFTIQVRTGKHPSGVAIFFQKKDANGVDAGREVAIYGAEVDAMELGLEWLMGEQHG